MTDELTQGKALRGEPMGITVTQLKTKLSAVSGANTTMRAHANLHIFIEHDTCSKLLVHFCDISLHKSDNSVNIR